MPAIEHLRILNEGYKAWNKWRNENHEIKPDLREANLRKAKLIGMNFSETNLRKANLVEANLRKANLINADLREADLYKTNLFGADLSEADLRKANLTKSLSREASFVGANLTGAILIGADLSIADLRDADLRWASLELANLVETNLEGTDLSGSNIYGISAWDLKINKKTKQLNLAITKIDEPIITVDDLEVAQFIYLLLKHENLRQVLNSVTERGVLILGRFGGGGIEVLLAVAEKLREMKYLPIIFDFDRPRDRNYTETIKTLAGLSRFVVVDLSGPSVPQELYATVPHFKIPFIPILEKGKQKYAMFADILEFDWVMKPIVEFDSIDSLINSITSKVVNPAEKRLEKRQKLLFELFGK